VNVALNLFSKDRVLVQLYGIHYRNGNRFLPFWHIFYLLGLLHTRGISLWVFGDKNARD